MRQKSISKQLIALLLSIILVLAGIPFSANAADSTVQQVNNIVLFAQFPDTDGNFMANKTDDAIAMCNSTDTFLSLTSYIDAISYGKMHVDSYFPQLQDGIIQPYTLEKSRSSYTDYEQYAWEMVSRISVPTDIPLDGNHDGAIDNITLVIDGQAESMGDPLWAKAFHLDGAVLNDTYVSSINLLSSYTLLSSTIFSGVGTLCHEFLHSMGYPDLYRQDSTSGNPVGQWDIMATSSVFLQYPLAYQRYAVSGWLDAETITADGTYTLYPASASKGNRLYLLKTPFSDTEFFAVEYRVPGKQYSDELDEKIYGEGLVVYRINTAVQGNYRDSTDGIYVFRPGETKLNEGQGDLKRSNYGGADAPDSIGSTDLEKTFLDGALVYTDGTNSGIALNNIQINGDGTLSFSASFADVSDRQLWQTIDAAVLPSKTSGYDMCTSDSGNLFLFCTAENSGTLYQMQNDKLQAVSTPLSGNIYNPKLAFCGETPYLLWQDNQYLLRLSRWNGTAWENCYTGTELAQYADLAADDSHIWFTYTTGSFPYVLHGAVYDPASGSVTEPGGIIAENACNMEIGICGTGVCIGYRDLDANSVPKLAVWDGSSWTSTTLSDQDCGTVAVQSGINGVWIAPSGGKTDVYHWNGSGVTAYPLPEAVQGRAFQVIPAESDNTCYLAVNAQNPEEFSLYALHPESKTWSLTGNPIAQELVNQPILAAQNNTIYCLYTTSELQPQLKKLLLTTPEKTIPGDINNSGSIDLTDAVLLQQYLLGIAELNASQYSRADFFADNAVNGLDLALLRQKLLEG